MAAIYQNYGGFQIPAQPTTTPPWDQSPGGRIPVRDAVPQGTTNWGSNFMKDLFSREDVRMSVLEEYFWMNKFQAAGIIARNTELDGRSGGVVVEYPFFQPMYFEEEDVDSNEYWGASGQGYLTPQKIQTSKFVIPRVSKGFAFGSDDLSKIISNEDPMAAMRSYIASNLNTFRTRYLLTLLKALFTTGGALGDQKFTATAPATGTQPDATQSISVTQVIAALNLLGERSSNISSIAMHSSMYHYLMQQGMLTFSSPAGVGTGSQIQWGGGGIGVTSAEIGYFAGLRIVVDDMIQPEPIGDVSGAVPGDAKRYPVWLFGPGAVQEGVQREFRMEMDRNILSFQDIAACHYIWGLGVPGINWVGTPSQIAQGSINAAAPVLPAQAWNPIYPHLGDIANAANWQLAWSHREFVPIVKMEAYSPYGGVYV